MNSLMDNAIRLVGLVLCGFGITLAANLEFNYSLTLSLLAIPATWTYCKVTMSDTSQAVSPLRVALALVPFLLLVLAGSHYGGVKLALAVILNTFGTLFMFLPINSDKSDRD